MTAAEKREKWLDALSSAVLLGSDRSSGGTQARKSYLREVADLLTFTDDEPAAPAQEPDWRDEAVKTGWTKLYNSYVRKIGPAGITWDVGEIGIVEVENMPSCEPNNDPLSRCRAIDRFLSDLAGEGVS